jgi:dynein heavy chain
MSFSAQTTAMQTQNIIDGKTFKLRRGTYVPQDNKKGIIFVDDLNMPKIETPGINATQPAIELLRQWMDYKGWYDILGEEKDFKNIINFTFITAMSPPGAGKIPVTLRYIRHFNVIYCEPYSSESLRTIFSTVMDWFWMQFTTNPFSPTIKSMKEKIVVATIATYDQLAIKFRPTPAKSHYTYNLRDVSKVFQGIAKTEPRAMINDDSMIKLWAHECLRVYHDRLVSQGDRDNFLEMLKEQM